MSVTLYDRPASYEEDMHQYLQDIRQYPILTPKQELELAKGCAEGDEDAIRQMVNSNLRLVTAIAKEYAGRGVPLLDLIQEGSLGLLVAARKFDYTMQTRFSTYADNWIRQRILRYIANHSHLIRIPPYTGERIRKLYYARSALLQQNGTEPTVQELAQYCELDEEKVVSALQLHPEVFSLDAPAGEDEETTMQALLEDTQTLQPHAELVHQELKQNLEALLAKLTKRQQEVLRLRFGMVDGVYYSLEQIGIQLGITKERARQLEQAAVAKLQRLGTGIGLEDFLE